jgi:hypothetical protein
LKYYESFSKLNRAKKLTRPTVSSTIRIPRGYVVSFAQIVPIQVGAKVLTIHPFDFALMNESEQPELD